MITVTKTLIASILFSGSIAMATSTLDGIKATKIGGKEVDIGQEYAGKVLLIANTASMCGYTPQLGGMQALSDAYASKGLQVLAFPSNDFKQEHADEKAIADVCSTRYRAKYPVFRPISVSGKAIHPLFKQLTEQATDKGDVKWNFEKFVVGRDGKVLGRFRSKVDPTDAEVRKLIESALAGKG
jgi:glutathione peroxidase